LEIVMEPTPALVFGIEAAMPGAPSTVRVCGDGLRQAAEGESDPRGRERFVVAVCTEIQTCVESRDALVDDVTMEFASDPREGQN
jgi:hypothetical protein